MAVSTAPTARAPLSRRWLVAGLVVIVLAILAALAFSITQGGAATSVALPTTTVGRGTLVATVAGSGSIAAEQTLDLPFRVAGSVTEVLVAEGELVQAGQPLARLDTRDLALQVANAEASLQSAEARLAQLLEGNATPEQLAASRASVASAEANLAKTRSGNVTAADIAEAEAQVRSAQATLDDLLAGPKADTLASAQSSYDQAVAELASQRASLSAAKTTAESALLQAAESLRNAQDEYSRIYWDNRELEKLPGDLSQARKDEEAAALRAVSSAEESVRQRQVALDESKEAERTGLARAEAQLRNADEQLRSTQAGAEQVEIVKAQASLDQAQANLQRLRQGGTAADVAAAQAGLDQAQANLDQLSAPATATDLSQQEAAVAQARNNLAQARLNLEQATLSAPFGGIVTAVNIVPGSEASSAAPALTLVNRDPLHIDLRLSENDAAQVTVGMPVELSIDALPDWATEGTVSYVAPAAETTNDVVTYRVRVAFPDTDAAVKVGMTANLEIRTATREDVLLVPNTALQPKGAGRVVLVQDADGTTSEVEVQTGLSDGVQTELLGGLPEGAVIVINPNAAAPGAGGGLFGN